MNQQPFLQFDLTEAHILAAKKGTVKGGIFVSQRKIDMTGSMVDQVFDFTFNPDVAQEFALFERVFDDLAESLDGEGIFFVH